MLIFPRYPWGEVKPAVPVELNRSHELAHGLVGAWLLNNRPGGLVRDYTGNNHGTVVGSTVQSVVTRRGRSFSFSGDNNNHRIDLGSIDSSNRSA